MTTSNESILKMEFALQMDVFENADEIILYGNSVITPIIAMALEECGINKIPRLFERGHFVDGKRCERGGKKAVILCGMRMKTRVDMQNTITNIFSDAKCFDYFAIYYYWITILVKRNCDYNIFADTLIDVRNEHAITNIDSINTSFCNLNCKECSNGMQYRRKKKNISPDSQIKSISNLTSVLPIAYCNIQGGEPFTDMNLSGLILHHAENARIAFISVATNGTILPDDDVMVAMRKAGIVIRISDYGELSKRKKELSIKARKFNVPCEAYQRAREWVTYGDLKKHHRNDNENRKINKTCFFGTKDIMLYDGKLYCCCRTLLADAKGMNNNDIRLNTLNVMEKISYKDLENIISGQNLWRMCDYCDYPMQTVVPAEQALRGENYGSL